MAKVFIDECFPIVEEGERFVSYYTCDCGNFQAVSHELGDRVTVRCCTCSFQTMFCYNIPGHPMIIVDERPHKAPVSQL